MCAKSEYRNLSAITLTLQVISLKVALISCPVLRLSLYQLSIYQVIICYSEARLRFGISK